MGSEDMRHSETYLCLSQAFLVPRGTGRLAGFAEALPADLAELLDDTHDNRARIDGLRRAASHIRDDTALLRGYTALFLTPPYKVALNAGLHLDGAIMGPAEQQIRHLYRRYGLDRAEGFRDLPDHLGALLEFAAYLHAILAGAVDSAFGPDAVRQDLAGFLRRYVARWRPGLTRSLKRALPENDTAALYLSLTDILDAVVEADLASLAITLPPASEAAAATAPPERHGADRSSSVTVPCARCGEAMAADESLREMTERLESAGLSTDHLRLCRDCRGSALGLTPLKPVTAKSGKQT
ncbi:MAG: molecular chaperone TorD family protein [Rhodovibrio sp.]|nr:molecular chaperone TorD family protein [Rhodovibrio sp.]